MDAISIHTADYKIISEEYTMKKLQLEDGVKVLVVAEQTTLGIASNRAEIELLLENHYRDELDGGVTTTSIEYSLSEDVQLFPLLSGVGITANFKVVSDIDVTVNEDIADENEVFIIEDIDAEFDDEDELREYLEQVITDGEYTVDEVARWDIFKRVNTSMNVDIDRTDREIYLAEWRQPKVEDYVTDGVAELIEELDEMDEDLVTDDVGTEEAIEAERLTAPPLKFGDPVYLTNRANIWTGTIAQINGNLVAISPDEDSGINWVDAKDVYRRNLTYEYETGDKVIVLNSTYSLFSDGDVVTIESKSISNPNLYVAVNAKGDTQRLCAQDIAPYKRAND